ncbi:MAG: prephenate dehydrogenase [Clostridia bacterium]|nr:prephenate dehydrogenase [Clostridia bacterium]
MVITMKILICGLGLIGGSLARALKFYTDCYVCGYDVDINSARKATLVGACDEAYDILPDLSEYDVIVLAAYPKATLEFIKEHAGKIGKSTYLFDLGGVKRTVCEVGFAAAREYGFTFIGGHPMAGTQYSGFAASRENLYKNASMILVPPADIDVDKLDFAVKFFKAIGFATVSVTTAKEHDEIIAYTSQLAHVLSNAYVKSPTAKRHKGYSAGSFRDLTRVAHLNSKMWRELFMDNRDLLVPEIELLAKNLLEYADAMKSEDGDKLERLLAEGSRINDEIKGE